MKRFRTWVREYKRQADFESLDVPLVDIPLSHRILFCVCGALVLVIAIVVMIASGEWD